MRDKLRKTVETYQMFGNTDTVIVGVSGGADSMALLHALQKEYPQLRVIAAHVNHLLRGENAQRDEDFVRSWCAENAIPCEICRKPIRALAEAEGIGEEACGRQERYRFFEALAIRYHAKIATAHTLSDTAETVLFHLARGTGSRGLCGIPPVRNNIVRPLIFCTRAETEQYCKENNIAFVTDESNFDTHYARNRIRQCVMPEMLQINSAFPEAIRRMTVQLTEQERYLDEQVERLISDAQTAGGYDAGVFLQAPHFLATRALLRIAEQNGAVDLDFAAAERLTTLLSQAGAVNLHGGVSVRQKGGFITAFRTSRPVGEKMEPIVFFVPCSVKIGSRCLSFQVVDGEFFRSSEKVYRKFLSRALDYDTISTRLTVRTRLEGDRFTPANRNGSKSLKKLLNEAHIPTDKRATLLLLESAGEICWIEGFGASEKAKPTPVSTKILLITEENEDGQYAY